MALDVTTVPGEPGGVSFSPLGPVAASGTAGSGTTHGKEREAGLDVSGDSSSTRPVVSDLSDSSGGEDDMLQRVCCSVLTRVSARPQSLPDGVDSRVFFLQDALKFA